MTDQQEKKKLNIFLIEDDEDIREILSLVLKQAAYQTVCAENGKAALETLRKTDTLPDLIILDLMMPVMDGIQFRHEQLNDERLAPIPVVIMSADGKIGEKLSLTKTQSYIKKPFTIEELNLKVSKALKLN